MDLVCACDGLSPLPVEEKAIMVTWRALAIPYLRLRWAFPSACLRKGCLMDLVCACDGLSPLPVEEKAISSGRKWISLCGLPKWGQMGPSRNSKAGASVISPPPRVSGLRRASAS